MSGPGTIVCLSCRGGCIGRIPGLAGVRTDFCADPWVVVASRRMRKQTSSASLFKSSMAPYQVLSDRIATNWSDLVGSNAKNASSLHSNSSSSHSSQVSTKLSNSSGISMRGGPTFQPAGLSHACTVSSKDSGVRPTHAVTAPSKKT